MNVNRGIVGNFLDMHLYAESFQIVNIKIYNIVGEKKISKWEELNKGENKLIIDVSSLLKGMYRITISYLNEKLKEEQFTLY